jgi:hypothetical protein
MELGEMRYTVSNNAQLQLTMGNDTVPTQHIVKLAPRVHMKTTRQRRIPNKTMRISIKPTSRNDAVKKKKSQLFSSSSFDSGNTTSSNNDETSLDDNSLHDASVSEIIALLEQARSRSRNSTETDEVNTTLTTQPNIPHSSPQGPASYY